MVILAPETVTLQRLRLARIEEIDAQVAQLREDKRNTIAAMQALPDPNPDPYRWSERLASRFHSHLDWLEAHVTSIDEQVADLARRRDAILAAQEVPS